SSHLDDLLSRSAWDVLPTLQNDTESWISLLGWMSDYQRDTLVAKLRVLVDAAYENMHSKERDEERRLGLAQLVTKLESYGYLLTSLQEHVGGGVERKGKKSPKFRPSKVELQHLSFLKLPVPSTLLAVRQLLPDVRADIEGTFLTALSKLQKKELKNLLLKAKSHAPPRITHVIQPSVRKILPSRLPIQFSPDQGPSATEIARRRAEFEGREKKRVDAACKLQRWWRERLGLDGAEVVDAMDEQPQELNECVLGPWSIFLAERASTSMKVLAKNRGVIKPVFAALQEIARGRWTGSIMKTLKTSLRVRVLESKILRNLRLVWQVDVAYLPSIRAHSQIIKIWCIGNHTKVEACIERLKAAHAAYSIEHVKRCGIRVTDGDGSACPKLFPDDGGESSHVIKIESASRKDKSSAPSNLKIDPLLIHDMAVTAKFIPLSKMFVDWILDPSEDAVEFPFALSAHESGIVKHRGSILLCGRSGTGKTTCALFRLLSMLHAFSGAAAPLYSKPGTSSPKKRIRRDVEIGSNLHQIFVTASPIFCARVRTYFTHLLQAVTKGRTP
ncbi:hypothetical protein BDK51DRAFT_26218, partial [Blyttiomyces helicus]